MRRDDLRVAALQDSQIGDGTVIVNRPVSDAELAELVESMGYVKREEMERAVESEHERGNRYADALLESYRGALVSQGWVKRPVCGECDGLGEDISGSECEGPPCPSCGGTGFGRLVGASVELLERPGSRRSRRGRHLMLTDIRFRIETPHLRDDGCQGWWWFPGDKARRATDGSKRGRTTSWLIAQCNKAGFSECEATALVSLSDLEAMLEAT